MFPPRPVGLERSVRHRVLRGLGVASVFGGVALAAWVGAPRAVPAALWGLERLPADPRCGHPVGQLAALARGEVLPDEPCLADLARAPAAPPLLAAIARDNARPWRARASALSALVGGGYAPEALLESFIVAPKPPPSLRRAGWALGADGRDAADWVDRGGTAAVHGLYDRAAARRFAGGEPGSATGAARALGASPGAPDPAVLKDVYAGLGTTPEQLAEASARSAAGQMPLRLPPEWTNALRRHRCDPTGGEGACVPLLLALLEVEADRGGEEPGPSAPAVPAADAAIDAAYTDGERSDHVREELAAVAAWIARSAEPWRAARLVAAVLHPDATAPTPAEALDEAGDVHAVLVRGGSSPGATALAATDLALATRVPIATWATDTGVALQVGGGWHRVDMCAASRPVSGPAPEWQAVPMGGVAALALVEGAARSLRERDFVAARAQVDAARAAWADARGLAAVEAAVLAAEAGSVPYAGPGPGGAPVASDAAPADPPGLLGIPGPGTRFVSRPTFAPRPRGRRSAPPPPPELRPAARAALLDRLDRIRAFTPDPEDRVRAAWWAADGGDADLARRLLVPRAGEHGPATALGATLWAAVARGVGEPAGIDPKATAGAHACPAPYRADPPLDAWDGEPPTGG